jgi:hypothetical protein
MRLFPGIAFRGADWERRAGVIGTALDVWQIVEARHDIGSIKDLAAAAQRARDGSGSRSRITSGFLRRSTSRLPPDGAA